MKSVSAAQNRPAWGASVAIEDRFRPMIAKLEAVAAKNPRLYRGRVFRRALLGYGYIALVIAGIIVTLGVMVAAVIFTHIYFLLLKGAILLLVPLGYVLKSLWIKTPPPVGQRIEKREAPALFALLDEVRRKTKGPRVQAVYIIEDFNASIVQTARFGPFLGHRNTLSLGLPLLCALPPEEVKAVIAHEYGHLAGAHGKMSAWIYRVRMTWLNLSQSFGRGFFADLFRGFFDWYGPWFSAYSFVLARGNEYEADAASGRVAGNAVAARALTRVAIESQRFNRYWSTLFDRSGDDGQVFPYAAMSQHFVQPMPALDLAGALQMATAEETDIHDTHPSLTDRLRSLKESLPELEPVGETGADALLGAALTAKLSGRFDEDWWGKASGYWTQRREETQAQRRQLAELEAKAAAEPLDDDDDWAYRELLEVTGDAAGALSVAEKRFAAKPDELAARLVYGRLLLESDDGRGLDILAPALDNKPQSQVRLFALSESLAWLRRHAPDDARIADWQAQLEAGVQLRDRIDTELNNLNEASVLEPAGIDDAAVAALRTRAAKDAALQKLWLAKRRLTCDAEEFQYVLLVMGSYPAGEGQAVVDDMLGILQAYGNTFVIIRSAATDWLKGRMERIDGALIVKR